MFKRVAVVLFILLMAILMSERAGIWALRSAMDGVFVEVNWLNVVLVVETMVKLVVILVVFLVEFSVVTSGLVMLNILVSRLVKDFLERGLFTEGFYLWSFFLRGSLFLGSYYGLLSSFGLLDK
jgi:hypothetical protein